MIEETTDAQILKDAKGIFERQGGAVGVKCDNQGRVCAASAAEIAWTESGSCDPSRRVLRRIMRILNDTTCELFDDHVVSSNEHPTNLVPLAQLNDTLGTKAVLNVYDLAIKKAEEE